METLFCTRCHIKPEGEFLGEIAYSEKRSVDDMLMRAQQTQDGFIRQTTSKYVSQRLQEDKEKLQQYETELEENREMVVEAKEFCDRAHQGALSRLTRIITTEAEKNVVVFNPLAQLRTDVVRLEGELPQSFRLVDASTGKDAAHQVLPDGSVIFIAEDMPSMGYKTYSVVGEMDGTDAAAPMSTDDLHEKLVLDNRFYRVQFNAATGAIAGIHDKQLGVELVDQTAPHQFNEYLYRRYELPDPRIPTAWYRVESAQVEASRGAVADIVTVDATPVGVKSLRQTVILYHDLKRIDFMLDMEKSPSGCDCNGPDRNTLNREALFVALPFAVPEGRFHHELPGGVVEPIRDQFDTACTTFYAVRHFSDVSNNRYGATLASVDGSLMEYGRPRSFEHWTPEKKELPNNSRMYLYLLNNLFPTNARFDQAGPMSFAYSLRSHEGDWRSGCADEFGWSIHNPLLAEIVAGKRQGMLPVAAGFVSVDKPNVACTTLKPAEFNGAGLILRFMETRGLATDAVVSLPLLGPIASAVETDLVENDRPAMLDVKNGAEIAVSLRPFGVKTIRVQYRPRGGSVAARQLTASAVSDMETALAWQVDDAAMKDLSHFNVYRARQPDFKPSLLNLVARPVATAYTDRPELRYGGWINNRIEPETTYYYKVSAVDRWNNEGPRTDSVAVTTLAPTEKNMTPLRVECLRAIYVSHMSPDSFVNLLFRTNCESDIVRYEIHRSTQSGFLPDDSNRIGVVDAEAIIKGEEVFLIPPQADYPVRDFDHAMFQDDAVQPGATYYYKVCAVDRAGKKGPYSEEAGIRVYHRENKPKP